MPGVWGSVHADFSRRCSVRASHRLQPWKPWGESRYDVGARPKEVLHEANLLLSWELVHPALCWVCLPVSFPPHPLTRFAKKFPAHAWRQDIAGLDAVAEYRRSMMGSPRRRLAISDGQADVLIARRSIKHRRAAAGLSLESVPETWSAQSACDRLGGEEFCASPYGSQKANQTQRAKIWGNCGWTCLSIEQWRESSPLGRMMRGAPGVAEGPARSFWSFRARSVTEFRLSYTGQIEFKITM
jgi:hypothetical protein